MTMNRFIGRRKELEFLKEKYSSDKGELVLIYGEKRAGKTETLREFSKNKKAVIYTCTQIEDRKQLNKLSNVIASKSGRFTFESWEKAFSSIVDLEANENGKRILIIDEFPYAVMANKAIPSILQKLWDTPLKNENVLIILCGSAMSFIEREMLSEKNPLYSRLTGIYKMEEMPFFDVVDFLDGFSNKDKIAIYSICGGIPYYLEQFSSSLSLKENIIKSILNKDSILYSEPELLLRQELRELSIYNTIICSIALGKTMFSEIQNDTSIEKRKLSVYLRNLIELGFIERELPVVALHSLQTNPHKGIYRIKSSFFSFWYAFVFPNMTLLEFGDAESVYTKLIEPNLDRFASYAFGNICIEYLKRKNMKSELPFTFTSIGRWWDNTTEVACIALDDDGNTISADCNYNHRKATIDDLRKHLSKRIGSIYHEDIGTLYHYYFSFSGFEDDAIAYAKDYRITLVDEQQLFN